MKTPPNITIHISQIEVEKITESKGKRGRLATEVHSRKGQQEKKQQERGGGGRGSKRGQVKWNNPEDGGDVDNKQGE